MTHDQTALEIARELRSSMPSIGFVSKSKRIGAYVWTAERALTLANGNKQTAAEALAILIHLSKRFRKAVHITVLNLEPVPAEPLTGFSYHFARMAAIRKGLDR